jgi:hypothetical protein
MPPKRSKGKGRAPTVPQKVDLEETQLDFTGYLPGTDLDKDLERGMDEEGDDILEDDAEFAEDDNDDDDKDSIEEWIQDDEEMEDNEIM